MWLAPSCRIILIERMPIESPNPVQPHPILTEHYRDEREKREWLRTIFDDTARDYDRVEGWLAMGSGRWYRRKALQRAGLAPGMVVADVACGTGLVAREAVSIVGEMGRVIGIDPSPGMLGLASESIPIETRHGRAEAIPSDDVSFDFVSMGYALRHVDDLAVAFAEFRRVLKPDGRLCILEITSPESRLGRGLMAAYIKTVAGVFCRVGGKSKRTSELWRYYWDTIDRCVRPQTVIEAMRATGLRNVQRCVQLGMFSEYTGTK